MPSYKEISIGQVYGSYSVVSEPYKNKKYYMVNLKCKCGKHLTVQTSDLHKFNKRVCRTCLSNSLRTYQIGSTHGTLTILELLLNLENKDKHKVKVICLCGNTYITSVKSFKTSKCCSLCNKAKKGVLHPSYKGVNNISKTYFTQVKAGATKRNLEFSITLEDMSNLFITQKGLCAITKLPIVLNTSKRRSEQKMHNTASLDRIDSSKGYTIDNIQWVHKHINFMKQEFSMPYFLELCQAVCENTSIVP